MFVVYYDGEVLHDPRSDARRLTDADCKLKVNGAGSLRFTVPPDHPLAESLVPMSASHEVTVEQNGTEIFRGRILQQSEDMQLVGEYEAQGQLGYLNDVLCRPYGTYSDLSNDPPHWTDIAPSNAHDFAEWLVERYNAKASPDRRFTVSVNQLPTKTIRRSSTQLPSIANELIDKVLEPFGCYLFATYSDGERMLEFRTEPRKAAQPIEFGRNLLDYAGMRDAEDVVTAVYAVGKTPYGEEGDAPTMAQYEDGIVLTRDGYSKRGDIVFHEYAVSLYGIIETHGTYEASNATELVEAACDDLAGKCTMLESVDVSAVDLNLADPSVMPWFLGDHIRVVSRVHGVNQWMMLTECTIDICDPRMSKYALGDVHASMSASGAIRTRSWEAGLDELYTAVEPLPDAVKAAAVRAEEAQATADSAAVLEYDHTYSLDAEKYTFTAHVYRAGEEITQDYPPEFYAWKLKTEHGEQNLGTGYTMQVPFDLVGYRASVVGSLADEADYALATDNGDSIVDSDGAEVIALVRREERVYGN